MVTDKVTGHDNKAADFGDIISPDTNNSNNSNPNTTEQNSNGNNDVQSNYASDSGGKLLLQQLDIE